MNMKNSEAPRGKPRGIFAEPCEATEAIHPCGKPQGFLAKKGKKAGRLFKFLTALLLAALCCITLQSGVCFDADMDCCDTPTSCGCACHIPLSLASNDDPAAPQSIKDLPAPSPVKYSNFLAAAIFRPPISL
jgi:hypothetical protein